MTSIPPDPQNDLQNQPNPGWQTRRDTTEPAPEPTTRLPRVRIFGSGSAQRQSQAHEDHPRASLFAHPIIRHAHKHFRRAFIATGVVISLIGIALILIAISLRHDMRASLPPLDGALHAPGLTLPVTVTRDAQSVPSITASSLDDVLFAQGFVTAQDRLWQMDALRRHAAGELAEILGPSMVEHDRLQRTLQIRAAADRATANLPAAQLHQLQCYANGVNAFIAQATDPHNEHLPVEFHVLHYKPAPWTPRDTLLVYLAMVQDLSTGFPIKLRREALAQHLPPQLITDLYPVGSWRDRPPTQPQPDLTTPVPEVEQIPLDSTQSRLEQPCSLSQPSGCPIFATASSSLRWAARPLPPISSPGLSRRAAQLATAATPSDILHLAHELPATQCQDCRAGSNNWAVAGSHSASGFPLVSNDMHLALNVPDIWYEAALHVPAGTSTPALDVTGFTLPGVPFIIVGRNQHVAWGFTNLGGDVQDVRIEHTRGSGANLEYEHADGSWSPVQHHTEHIIVRGGRNITLDVLTTTEHFGQPTMSARAAGVQEIETPIITPLLPSEHRTLSLAWTIYDPANITAPFLNADLATDGPSLVAALSTFGGPSLNLVYADDQNHIGYHALGAIPIRGASTQRPRALAPTIPAGPTPSDEEDQLNTSDESPGNSTPTENQPPPPPAPTDQPAPTYSIGTGLSPVPVDALDAAQIWSGYIPFDQLPNIVDPPNGLLATANARITPDDYPYAITLNWAPPYRAERIYKLLSNRNALTPADMLAVQNDTHSEFDLVFAQRLAYAIDHASPYTLAHDPKRLHQAADILRAWNGDVTSPAAAPAIVAATRTELLPMLLLPQIAAHDKRNHIASKPAAILTLYDWSSETVALEALLQHTPSRWLPPGFINWNDLLATALLRTLHDAHAPSDLSTWHYGQHHPVSIEHPVFSTLPLLDHLLGTPSGTGPHAVGGDFTTIKAIGPHFGSSERFTADLANPQATTGNITTGESGDPISPNYLDQFQPWLNGATFPLPLTNLQPTHTLTLLP